MFGKAMVSVALANVLAMTASISQAQVSNVFNMPTGQTSLLFVPVGNPNNPSDPSTGYGSVSYAYQMGEYDTTLGQYVQFLNAVAKTDTYGLYNSHMAVGGYAGYFPTIGISQAGSSGSYVYSVAGSDPQAANCPVVDVTWGDCARFCNWLQNGQPSYPVGTPGEVAGSTETGAYTLDGDTASYQETRNTGAKYFLPSENEWYKAAYYNPSTGTYWAYPTQSNVAPGNTLPDTGNNANYYNGNYSDPTNYLTPVGDFSASPGPYGTFDMGGGVWQWNEADIDNEYRGLRGGAWSYSLASLLASAGQGDDIPTFEINYFGFRVASVPEPSTVTLLLVSTACLLGYTWRRRNY